MDYDMYLFSCLLKLFDKDFDEQPYDYQYDILSEKYTEFEQSNFNDVNKSAYECIINFLKNKFKEK